MQRSGIEELEADILDSALLHQGYAKYTVLVPSRYCIAGVANVASMQRSGIEELEADTLDSALLHRGYAKYTVLVPSRHCITSDTP